MIITLHSECNVRRYDDISPIALNQTGSSFLFLPTRCIARQGSIGLSVATKSLFISQAGHPPFFVVIEMNDGSALFEKHTEIPVDEVCSVVIAFFKEIANFVVSQLFHI